MPVWIAISTANDWRWLERREDSPWYPSVRLFRQKTRGDWAEVFARMARELDAHPRLQSAARYAERGRGLLHSSPAEAAALLQQAIALEPDNAGLHNDLACALDRFGKREEALAGFEHAVRLKPDFAEAVYNTGNVLRRTGRPAEAEARYRQAVPLMKDSADLFNHLGIVLLDQAKHAEAESAFRRSLRLKPDNPHAHNNLGVLLERLRRIDEAIACHRESLRLNPASVDTHRNLALALLLRGDWLRGFAEYEWRCQSPGGPRRFAQPRWDGKPMFDGEAVLLHAEQGLGDTIHFVRYARLVKERGATVFVECPAELERLLGAAHGSTA